jgi:type VI protein secretion system component VasF
MKTITSLLTSSLETENMLSDLRLQVFQNFVSFLLSRCRELGNLKTQEEIELLWRRLLSLLAEDRRHHGDLFGDEFFLVECGLADELLQKIEWSGRDWWKANLLELKLFQTRTVGDRFYQMIDKLLAGRKLHDLPFAIILLETLALGFHGRLKSDIAEDENSWNRYRYELGLWIQAMLRECNKNFRRDRESLPAVLHEESLPVIPSLRSWYSATIILAIAMLLISHYLWWSNVKPLYKMINRTSLESVQAAEPTPSPLGFTVSN